MKAKGVHVSGSGCSAQIFMCGESPNVWVVQIATNVKQAFCRNVKIEKHTLTLIVFIKL